MSQVEWNLIFDDKYSDTGFVRYTKSDGSLFELRPSPFLENKKPSIYCSGDLPPPPEYTFIQTNVVKEDRIERSKNSSVKSIKTIDKWKSFDPTPLAERRKIIDYEEISDYFSKKYLGEESYVNEIATCSILYSFSSPPQSLDSGGINAAIFGRKYQWDYFKFPLRVIPSEMKRNDSYYYYYISEKEKNFNSIKSKEKNIALFKPEKTISDIPIVVDETAEKKISKDYRNMLDESSGIITAYILDSLLLNPKSSKMVEGRMTNLVYELIEDYKKGGYIAYNQNLCDALPKLSSSYARFHHNSEVMGNYVDEAMNLWLNMHHRTTKYYRTPLKIAEIFELSGDARKLYIELNEIFGVDYNIPIKEAFEIGSINYEDFMISIDTLSQKGFCIRSKDTIKLVDQY